MKSHSSLGMMAALALAASAGTGNAVEVMPRGPSSPSLPTVRPRKRRSHKRLNARVSGGNWQGVPYLSYAEHDRCVRATFGAPNGLARLARYEVEKGEVVASR
jgi:hypothetical protein